ncbi:unnamed protein product [Phytophthora lilii]|uniref:Unnamed protein product n=1 Tax=Phytophthora lilii TaxID=2077276 RepID=A0A9W6TDR5_9STRA|nr:unnamed protein product [Phytophthora lilii]
MTSKENEEREPLLTSVNVVCRENPRLFAEEQVLRRIETFLDYSPQYPFLGGVVASGPGALVDQKDEEGFPAVGLAAVNGHFEAVQWLIEQIALVDLTDRVGDTALHNAAAIGHFEMTKYLVDHGAYVDVKNDADKTALHYAAGAEKENVALVQFLVDRGLQVTATDQWGPCFQKDRPPTADLYRAFFEVAKGDNLNLLEYLVEYGADVHFSNFQGRNALHQASADSVVEYLLRHGVNFNQADKFGVTPLMEACRHGHRNVLQRILEAGGSIGDTNIAGQTALHLAAQGGHKEVGVMLLEHGANIHSCDKRGWTPLYNAAASGHVDLIDVLIANGARIDMETTACQTAESIAMERGHADVVCKLEENDATTSTTKPDQLNDTALLQFKKNRYKF